MFGNFMIIVGFVGSIASIISLIFLSNNISNRWIHALYVAIVAIVSGTAVHYSSRYHQVTEIGEQARTISRDREMNYTHEGFIQAGLAFLEKHKDIYPDTYERAKQICELKDCTSLDVVTAAHEMDGILRSLSTIDVNR